MSATDYRKMVTLNHHDQWIGVECTDGQTVRLMIGGSRS